MSADLLLVKFGVLTDVQYADCDDKPRWSDPNVIRHYRASLDQVDHAFAQWKNADVSFVLQLGDVIDCLNRGFSNSDHALQTILERFERHKNIPTFHTVGNHELFNLNHRDLAKYFYDFYSKLNLPPHMFTLAKEANAQELYYSFYPVPGVKFICLDCFDLSVNGYPETHPQYLEAVRILSPYHNHTDNWAWDCNCAEELNTPIVQQRFAPWNGGIGAEQLSWLDQELTDSDRQNEMVVVFGHVCLLPASTTWESLVWNYEEVLATFYKHRCVSAYLCGHTHKNGYARDNKGIHFVVFPAIVETAPSDRAFATITLYRDKLEIEGFGQVASRILQFNVQENLTSDCS